jgi:hypothetical protein
MIQTAYSLRSGSTLLHRIHFLSLRPMALCATRPTRSNIVKRYSNLTLAKTRRKRDCL